MRLVFPLLAVAFATAVAAETSPPAMGPVVVEPVPDAQLAPAEGRIPCRDTIHTVREERGLPRLQRDTASPDEPLLIAAVDHRINGCSVMVMRNDTSDVRPLPALPEGSGTLQRIGRE